MTRKLKCTVTGNWSYCSEERFQGLVKKFGSIAKLNEEYVSRQGAKLVEQLGSVAEARKQVKEDSFKNKIECTVTGELCYISDERMKKLIAKMGSEDKVREAYVSRVAKRLTKEGKSVTEIKAMAKSGHMPAPTSKDKPAAKAPAAKQKPAKDVIKDTVPAAVTEPITVGGEVIAKGAKKKAVAKKSAKK